MIASNDAELASFRRNAAAAEVQIATAERIAVERRGDDMSPRCVLCADVL